MDHKDLLGPRLEFELEIVVVRLVDVGLGVLVRLQDAIDGIEALLFNRSCCFQLLLESLDRLGVADALDHDLRHDLFVCLGL